MASEPYIDLLKESLSATQLFDLSADDYIYHVDTLYCERYSKMLYKLSNYLKEKFQVGPEENLQLITDLYEKFEENKNILLNCIEDFISVSIFRVPKGVVLPIDMEINEKIKDYSEDEDIELDKKIEFLVKSIKSKRAYSNLLRKNIALAEKARESINSNLAVIQKLNKK